MRRLLSLLIMVFCLSTLSTLARGPAPVILIVGDSLSSGHGFPVEKSWPRLLQQQLQAKGYRYRVINGSISGSTTSHALARFPAWMVQQPAIVIVGLGGNDGLRGLSLKAMRNNLGKMIKQVKVAKSKVLLLGVRLPPNYGSEYTREFNNSYKTVATQYHVALVPTLLDGVGGTKKYMQADGIHPNADAQPIIYRRVWKALQPLLKAESRSTPRP